jgi:hypothetical protein
VVLAVTMPPWPYSKVTDHAAWGTFRSTAVTTTARRCSERLVSQHSR